MKLTIDSNEPLDHVLHVIGAMYGVELSTPPVEMREREIPGDNLKTRHDRQRVGGQAQQVSVDQPRD